MFQIPFVRVMNAEGVKDNKIHAEVRRRNSAIEVVSIFFAEIYLDGYSSTRQTSQ